MIIFRNPGVIDLASITTFGVSSKEKPGAIGFFGTGLKYALAILLREGCTVTIFAGGQVLTFGTEKARVRVDEFTFITMNGERLGFTTELGKTWELWTAFRELYCNTMDENGTVQTLADLGSSGFEVSADETVITVVGDKFREVWDRRREIILESPALGTGETCALHPGPSSHVYYRGVKAATLDKPALFTYNVLRKLDLTEDRTVKYPWDVTNAVKWYWVESKDEDLIRKVLTAPKGSFEHDLDWSGFVPGETFQNVVAELYFNFDRSLNGSAWEACSPWLRDRLADAKPKELSDLDTRRLARAVGFCSHLGFEVEKYPVVVSDFLGTDVLGMAHKGKIMLSTRVFEMGTKMVAGTLIEEYLHLTYNVKDESRQMQNMLLDRICSLGERIVGEPL